MAPRRSVGRLQMARALWYVKPGRVELRAAPQRAPGPGEARVRTLFSGISRGTERLVFNGCVARTEWDRMRCPHQDGDFPFPVKYGYCATGIVEDGPRELIGRPVFCLHPHQDVFVASVDALVPLPEGLPPRRATLAANMETALNAHWDGAAGPGDRIVVVGAGVVGLMVASLAARLPGTDVTVIDIVEDRRPLVEGLGARFVSLPSRQACSDVGGADLVFHTSASAAGLETAMTCAGFEGTIVEMSWYGDRAVEARFGDTFHSQRLKLVSSQVGKIAASHRERWSYRRRLATALQLLGEARLDALVAGEIAFADAATALPKILAPDASGLAPVICYPGV